MIDLGRKKVFYKVALSLLIFLFPIAAQGASSEELQAQLQALLQQVASLQVQLAQTNIQQNAGTPELSTAQSFQSDLRFGLTNDADTKRLQDFLIRKGYLASIFNTGSFFTKTFEAVKNYQAVHGIAVTGYFGPLTRAAVNAELVQEQSSVLGGASAVSPGASFVPPASATVIPPPPPPATVSGEAPVLLSQSGSYTIYAKPKYDVPKLSRRIQELVNEERLKNGLSPLLWNNGLAEVARLHSEEQAPDNIVITSIQKPCSYPYIRHEGFTKGLTVGNRLKASSIAFQVAGENIAAFSVNKNFIYQYNSSEGSVGCPDFPVYTKGPTGETQDQAKIRIQNDIQRLLQLVNAVREVQWVNKEWLTSEEIAKDIVSGWMASEGHRKNILDQRFVEGGIGVAEVNDYFIVTHVLMKAL